MYKQIYTIPIAGTQDLIPFAVEKSRVGNIFNAARQKVIITTNTDAAASRMLGKYGIDTFAKFDSDSYNAFEIKNTEDDPILIKGESISGTTKFSFEGGRESSIYNVALLIDGGSSGSEYSLLSTIFDAGNHLSIY